MSRTSIARVCALALILAGSTTAMSGAAPSASIAPAPRNTTPYPTDIHDNFISGCREPDTVNLATCECFYRKLEQQLTVEEFIALDKASEAGDDEPLPEGLVTELKACLANPNS
ncbi:MAG: hypothetical protein KF842_14085 [Caulobacter sp.]|nr:hypothetical protein [Caulobacter sp.]